MCVQGTVHDGRVTDMQVFADRTHRFAAPVWAVFRALTEERGHWVQLERGEMLPTVVDAVDGRRIVWSSMWPVRPDDTIEFELSRAARGTAVRYRWFTDSPPDERDVNTTRQRLNRNIGGCLRRWVDSLSSPTSWVAETPGVGDPRSVPMQGGPPLPPRTTRGMGWLGVLGVFVGFVAVVFAGDRPWLWGVILVAAFAAIVLVVFWVGSRKQDV
jgi:hypothetical protein